MLVLYSELASTCISTRDTSIQPTSIRNRYSLGCVPPLGPQSKHLSLCHGMVCDQGQSFQTIVAFRCSMRKSGTSLCFLKIFAVGTSAWFAFSLSSHLGSGSPIPLLFSLGVSAHKVSLYCQDLGNVSFLSLHIPSSFYPFPLIFSSYR